jgi:uncharacterized protein with HEPN domain
MRRDRLRLEDILEALDSVGRIVANRTEQDFLLDEVVQYAVAQRLTTVGEACARISTDMRAKYQSVPWGDIVGFRNILVLEYFGIHWPSVWLTAVKSAPTLRSQIAEIISLEFPASEGTS